MTFSTPSRFVLMLMRLAHQSCATAAVWSSPVIRASEDDRRACPTPAQRHARRRDGYGALPGRAGVPSWSIRCALPCTSSAARASPRQCSSPAIPLHARATQSYSDTNLRRRCSRARSGPTACGSARLFVGMFVSSCGAPHSKGLCKSPIPGRRADDTENPQTRKRQTTPKGQLYAMGRAEREHRAYRRSASPVAQVTHTYTRGVSRPRTWHRQTGLEGPRPPHDEGGSSVRGGGKSTIQDFDEARKFLREEGIPRLSAMPGFVSGHWVKLGENDGASMIIFETEEAAQAAKSGSCRARRPP